MNEYDKEMRKHTQYSMSFELYCKLLYKLTLGKQAWVSLSLVVIQFSIISFKNLVTWTKNIVL